jgi:hypothetical protein
MTWSLVFLPTKLSVLLKIIFFISLKTIKITSKIQISVVCDRWSSDIQFHKYAVHFNGDFFLWFYDQLCPQILSVGTTANAPLSEMRI